MISDGLINDTHVDNQSESDVVIVAPVYILTYVDNIDHPSSIAI